GGQNWTPIWGQFWVPIDIQLGADRPGPITVLPMDAEEISEERIDPEYHLMSDAEVAGYIKDLPIRPLYLDADGELRLTLAGVHHKAALPLPS
ncbi:hypothetical protein MRS76_24565, partial [Rhizobiaceae bacterium n13]|nr:hypothetical protein [Fererhizobium litorale]